MDKNLLNYIILKHIDMTVIDCQQVFFLSSNYEYEILNRKVVINNIYIYIFSSMDPSVLE